MNHRLHPFTGIRRYMPSLLLMTAIFVALPMPTHAEVVEVIVEDPQLHPAYTTCPDSYWYPFANNRGHTAYLTLNVKNPANSANYGEWRPVIPQPGYYRVSAYIAAHTAITWCTGDKRTIDHDTTNARYSIYDAFGVSTRELSQYPLSNQWLDLGEYYFTAGQSGYVSLADLNSEVDFTTSISFSAMRFTYTRPMVPRLFFPFIGRADLTPRPPGDVGVIQAQGFDSCHLPTVTEMDTWWHQSPYAFYALYLGGVQLSSVCTIATAPWVSQVHQQGWSFVPTWVGLQAPCTTYTHKMSSDPTVAYQQGRQEAQAASAAAVSLGLSSTTLGGTIIYYDLEAYGYSTPECRQPVSAFMNGWVQRLHELGNLAGGYGTRNSFMTDWAYIPNVPDDVWPAYWYASGYDPYASVYGIPWLQGLWTNHQRIRQYAGDHPEHWGGVGLGIDSDVADGMVAMPPPGWIGSAMITSSTTVEDTGWFTSEQGWLVEDGQLYWTSDGGKAWQDISPATIQRATFLPDRQAWALSIGRQAGAILFHSADWGVSWENLAMTLPLGDWRSVQLNFTSASTGWVVLRKETSQAFNIGILMKTSNGGDSWQTYELPFAAPVSLNSNGNGWLISETGEGAYQTIDGGLTWQPAQAGSSITNTAPLPQDTIQSGWQTDMLGWAITTESTCRGEKGTSDFTCQVKTQLWQTSDGGQAWNKVQLPTTDTIVQ